MFFVSAACLCMTTVFFFPSLNSACCSQLLVHFIVMFNYTLCFVSVLMKAMFLFGNSLYLETTDVEIFRALNVSFKQNTSSACAASLRLFYFFWCSFLHIFLLLPQMMI